MNRIFPRLAAASLVGILSSLTGVAVHGQPNYIVSEIATAEWPTNLRFADMDGDGRQDLIIPHWSQETGRELLIHLQQSNGRFGQQVSRHVEIKPEIIAVAFADLRAEPGEELLLFSNSAVFSLSSAIPGYTGNLRQLFNWNFAAGVPDKREILFFDDVLDMNNDGHVDLLVPGRESYAVFHGGAGEIFTKVHEFTTVNTELDPAEIPIGAGRFSTSMQINERDGIVLTVTARSNSNFTDLLAEWDSEKSDATLLQTSNWMPSASLARMQPSQNTADIIYLNIGNDIRGQINILKQQTDGQYGATPDWQGAIDTRGEIRLLDFTGDGQQDLLRIVDNSNEWDVYFHVNRGGLFELERPDQIMKFSGYDLNISATDINGDGRPALSISYYTIPVVNAIRNTSIVRTQLLYANISSSTAQNSTDPVFNSRPDFKLDESFSAASVRGLSAQIHLQADLNGDGRKDAIYLTPEGTLAAKAIDSSFRFAAQPFWQHVPSRTIGRFDVVDLNGDNVPDIILYHSNAVSILVSTR